MLTIPTTKCWVCNIEFSTVKACGEHMLTHTKVELMKTVRDQKVR